MSANAKNCWPTKDQELLLRACLLSGTQGLEAWQKWRIVFENDELDKGSQNLLPLLYRNLQRQRIRDPLLARFKAEYFRTWSHNQLSFGRVAPLIAAFTESGIRTMILKGAALSVLFYEDQGLRPMADIDLLVPRDQLKQSIELLARLGWKSKYPLPQALVPFEHAGEFRDSGNQNLDLHWHVLWEGRQGLGDDDFWQTSMPIEINGVPTCSLVPADHLLHVCVHGAKWNDTPSLRWVADAMMIIRSANRGLDWNRLVAQAEKRQLTLPIRDTLEYLDTVLGANIPSRVLSDLQSARVSRLEQTFYKIRLGSNDTLRTIPVVWHWMNSLRLDCEGHLPRRLLQFFQYLQSLWDIKRLWQVPFYLVAKPMKRIYKSVA
jgi:hypothetical protein